jgi:hypothetical protein
MNFRYVFAVIIVFFCVFSSLNAQVTGRVTGSVIDATGAAVPGATVGLQLPSSGSSAYTTSTTANGDFQILSVNAGSYDLVIDSKGFLKVVIGDLKVNPGRATDVAPVKLEIATVNQSVEVTSAKDTVETSHAEVATTIVKSQIQNLPVLNRSPLGFLQTQAGINSARGSTTVNGLRPTFVNVTLDGVNIQDNFIRTNDVDFLPNLLLLDQVAEVTVITSNASAVNQGGSAQVQFVTPSGSNEFHGSALWSNRNNFFAANPWFNNQAGVARPFLNQNQFGGALGGRIIKNKLFFYTNYEAFRLNQQTPQNHTVMTDDARNGIYTYLVNGAPQKVNILQAAGVTADPTMAAMLAKVPKTINNFLVGDSTASLSRNTAGYIINKRANRSRDNLTAKGDYIFSPRNSFTLSYARNHDKVDRSGTPYDVTYEVVPTVANDGVTKLFSLAWRFNPGPTLTNEVRFGFNMAPGPFLISHDIPNFFVTNTTYTNPVNNYRNQGRNTDTFNIADNANWVKGTHTVAFGFQSQITRIESYDDAGITPTYTLDIGSGNPGLTSAQLPGIGATDQAAANRLLATLAGYVSAYTQNFNVASRTSGFVNGQTNLRHLKYDNYAFYGQDSWKLNRKLTLTYGARWDYFTPVDERDALVLFPVLQNGNVIQTLMNPNAMLDFAGSAVGRPWYKKDRNNIAPNIGLAFDPTGEGKWAIRAGYSLAYVNDNTVRALDNSQSGNAGLQATSTRNGLTAMIRNGLPAVTLPVYKVPRVLADNYALSTTSAAAMPSPDLVTPYVQQWSFGVQRSIKDFLIDARYVGNHATKQMRGFDYNQVIISQMMPDFLKAQNNGFLAQRAGQGFNPSYNASIPGSQPVPFFNQLASGGLLTNATISNLIQTGQVGELASTYQTALLNGSVNFFANPNILGANALTNYSNASYNGFQFNVARRLAHGLQFQANYVFSKVMSDTAGTADTNFEPFLDINNPKIERSRVAASDITHVIKANGFYELPFGRNHRFNPSNRVLSKLVSGWNIAAILTEQSGTPFSVLSARGTLNRGTRSALETANTTLDKSQLDEIFTFRMTGNGPYFVPQSVLGSDGRAVAADGAVPFNGQVFFQPAAGTIGGLQRNYFSGPWVFNTDALIAKSTAIAEGKTLTLRMIANNTFNHPTWFVGDQNISSATFGKITTTFFNRRLVQFEAVLKF